MRRPDFVVGAGKAGTTSFDAYLAAHPEIFMAKKEMHIFGSDLPWGPGFTPRTWDEYLAAFSDAGDAKRVGETSVGYLYSTRAAEEIKSFRPDAQIIAIVRNPTEVIHSFHSLSLYLGDEDIADLEQALMAEPDRKAGRRIPPSNSTLWALFYRDLVRYRAQLERYLDAFGEERVHVILYDDLRDRRAATYRTTLEFLGVDPDFTPECEMLNPNRRARIRAVSAVQSTPSMASSGPWMQMRRMARVAIPSHRARMRLYRWISRANTVYERRAPLPAKLKQRLEADLAEEVSELGALLGRDLSHWVGDGPDAPPREVTSATGSTST